MNKVTIYIPRDTAAVAMGVEDLITPIQLKAYGPVTVDDLDSLFSANWLQGEPHPLCHGVTEEIPYLKNQERLSFARVGIIDPLNLEDYAQHGGWSGLRNALGMDSQSIVQQVTDSGLRGRGGAAYPTGI